MSTWLKKELECIAKTDDLHISPLPEDGTTYGTPTWIWSVVVDGALYVRAYNGEDSRWYKAALRQKAGRITAAGMTKEVVFEPVDEIREQPLSEAHDRRASTRRDCEGGPARNQDEVKRERCRT